MQTYSFSSGDPRIKRKSCGRGTPKNDTGTLTPHQCNASCKGKCFSSFTCRNYLRSHSAHGLEVRKESNLRVGQGCPSLPERCLEWIPIYMPSTADASRHECGMPGAKHHFWCKPILFLLATRVLNASPMGEGLRKTIQDRSPPTSASCKG